MKDNKRNSFKDFFNRDVKEFNGIVLSIVSVLIIVGAGVFSHFIINSYALFSDEIESDKVLQVEVGIPLDKSGANKPVLSENMIPVYYDETNNVWRKADESNNSLAYQWYNYNNKIWANSVTVSSTSTATTLILDDGSTASCSGSTCTRSDYVNAELGTVIPMDDILTMQVWIPRYKYTVWNYNLDGTATNGIQEVQIEFEEGTATTGEIECEDNIQGTSDGTYNGTESTTSETCTLKATKAVCTDSTCNGKTYTHPAFTFGEKQLTGIWVGKFDVSSDINCEPEYESAVGVGCNIDSIRPLVKPNVASWRGAMTSIFENNMMKMNDSGNKYGFATSDDTHVIKNMEWGAVAYLSHSRYGICTNGECTQVSLNSNEDYITGCGPQSLGSTDYGSICNAYNTTLGQSASTTGNIYGVYDMGGGTYQYVMGNMVSPDGVNMISGYSINSGIYANYHSGYTGIMEFFYDSEEKYIMATATYDYPDSKYYDKYSFNKDFETINKSKLGDGMKEAFHDYIYHEYIYFPSGGNSWFLRGALGMFSIESDCGMADDHYSSRLAISQ